MGVIEDQSGSIAIGGLSPRQRVQHNPGLIGYVPQKVSMLNRTLKENVAIGVNAHDINEERVLGALEKVALGDVVFSLKDGIETIVGENGYNFSGGQIQRIGLARAIYTNPSILILDEATSALDAQTELAISESLAALEGEKTIIVVAHRLATVRKANKILYLGAENSFELGTFEELREQVPSFDKQAKLLGL
jgi:ABC-type multidrug transport system fused ATPase/permease subunit